MRRPTSRRSWSSASESDGAANAALAIGAPAAALALLGAHFYRAGAWPLLALDAGLSALLAVRHAWAVRTLQLALILGMVAAASAFRPLGKSGDAA